MMIAPQHCDRIVREPDAERTIFVVPQRMHAQARQAQRATDEDPEQDPALERGAFAAQSMPPIWLWFSRVTLGAVGARV